MNSYYREATVGLLVLLAVAIFLSGALWLRGRSVVGGGDLRVHFEQIGTLKEGSPVRISGAQVGRVEEITFNGVRDIVASIALEVDNVTVTSAATAVIQPVGMLGDMEIDLDPGAGTPLEKGALIEGTMARGIFDKGGDLADQAATTLTTLNRMLDTGLVTDLRRTLRASEQLLRYLADRQDGPTAQVNATMEQLQAVSARLDTTMAQVDAPALSARLDSTLKATDKLTARLAGMSARMDSLLGRINRGEGSLGKMVADSSLYVELRETLRATRALVDTLSAHPERVGITVRVF